MTEQMIAAEVVEHDNAARLEALKRDYAHVGEQLDRRGIRIDEIKRKVAGYTVAVPSWGVGTGGRIAGHLVVIEPVECLPVGRPLA